MSLENQMVLGDEPKCVSIDEKVIESAEREAVRIHLNDIIHASCGNIVNPDDVADSIESLTGTYSSDDDEALLKIGRAVISAANRYIDRDEDFQKSFKEGLE